METLWQGKSSKPTIDAQVRIFRDAQADEYGLELRATSYAGTRATEISADRRAPSIDELGHVLRTFDRLELADTRPLRDLVMKGLEAASKVAPKPVPRKAVAARAARPSSPARPSAGARPLTSTPSRSTSPGRAAAPVRKPAASRKAASPRKAAPARKAARSRTASASRRSSRSRR